MIDHERIRQRAGRALGRRSALGAACVLACAAALALPVSGGAASAAAIHAGRSGTTSTQTSVIPIPTPSGSPLFADIEFGDQRTGRVYLSDLANSSLDIIDGRSLKLVAQVPGFNGGPAGVVADDNEQIWAGDGSGAVKVVSATAPYRIIDSIPVGAPTADEIGYDPVDQIIAVTSPDATSASGAATPWVTLIDARPDAAGTHRILGHVVIPGAGADSIEQPQWDPSTRSFVESIRATNDLPSGAVARIDPVHVRLQALFPIDETCHPGGLAVGQHGQLLLGCNDGAPVLIDSATGQVLANYSGHDAGGADEVWYNTVDGRFYAAEAGAAGPPPLPQLYPPTVMVIDGRSDQFLSDIPLGDSALGFHQVTAIGDPARVFVPESDGLHVFTDAEEH
jgi:DNA-binding beta-propeller fold protein YncE